MARRKAQAEDTPQLPGEEGSLRKRSRKDVEELDDTVNETPSKRRRASTRDPYDIPDDDDEEAPKVTAPEPAEPTPTPKRKRGRPPKNATPVQNGTPTPSKSRQAQVAVTPSKSTGLNALTPRRKKAIDQSAKRKSARALIERVIGDEVSGEEDEDGLAREIYDSSDEDGQEGLGSRQDGADTPAQTPSKTPSRRGRKPKPKPRSPSPPRDLPPHELYFAHNKPGRARTSNNTLAGIGLDLLTHEEYFAVLKDRDRGRQDPHEEDIASLLSLHESDFGQWSFELSQGFSLCWYGLGSKRGLVDRFAEHTYALNRRRGKGDDEHAIVVVNGYARTLTLRDVLSTVASALDLDPSVKLPAQPQAMLQSLLSHLSSSSTASTASAPTPDSKSKRNKKQQQKQQQQKQQQHRKTITLLVNSIDAPPLRRPQIQQALSLLASHPSIQLVATADTPDFPLLWDAALRASFNFIFHDATTLAYPSVELDPVDDVHDLLGRQARAVSGKEGVAFVLRSLPENAKNLFRMLVTEVLVAMDDEGGGGGGLGAAGENMGVEYRMMYNKAVEEFVCSSEMAFRTLLKEFHDHQMITSRKDAIGTELLSVPFRREELEGILEELMT